MQKQQILQQTVLAAVIAAIYAAFTYLAAFLGVAYGPVQFRFSEALTILPVFTPAAIPGLAVGCLLGNLMSSVGAIDLVFGTAATLLAAICTRGLAKYTLKGVPVLATLPPVLFNAVLIGAEITLFLTPGAGWAGFWLSAAQVGLGQLAVCVGLGLPLWRVIHKTPHLKNLLQK